MNQISTILIGIFLIIVIGALPTMWLWNSCLEPAVDGINRIGFWQALGLNILATIFFKNIK
jgi:hypothetical protein